MLIRLAIQPVMGVKMIWLTFYPFIMVSALLGGFSAGVLCGFLSVAFALFGWLPIGSTPFISTWADWLGAGVFLLNTVMMSVMAWNMRRANARSKAAQLEAELANRAKSVFLAQMSHELRTPLNAILGFTNQLIRDGDVGASQRDSLKIISNSAMHLLELINNVLDMSRIETQKDLPEPKPVAIRELASDVAQLLSRRGEQKGLEISLDIDPSVPVYLYTDAGKLRRILVNLLGNAVKFSSGGVISVAISGVPVDAAAQTDVSGQWSGRLRLSVRDQGPGIDAQFHEDIFEPFFKLEQAENVEGSGLGLSITKQLVETLGGTIGVESVLGEGSCFTVEMPAAATTATGEEAKTKSETDILLKLAPGQKDRVCLIVDDNLDNRLLMKSFHQELGVHCLIAESGRQAVTMCAERLPDLVWMDIRMAGMDGIAAMKAIKNLPGAADLPIVAVTASSFAVDRELLEGEGFESVLLKPIAIGQLAECLTRFLGLEFREIKDAKILKADKKADTQNVRDSDVMALSGEERALLLKALDSLEPDAILSVIGSLETGPAKLIAQLKTLAESRKYTELKTRLLAAGQRGERDGT